MNMTGICIRLKCAACQPTPPSPQSTYCNACLTGQSLLSKESTAAHAPTWAQLANHAPSLWWGRLWRAQPARPHSNGPPAGPVLLNPACSPPRSPNSMIYPLQRPRSQPATSALGWAVSEEALLPPAGLSRTHFKVIPFAAAPLRRARRRSCARCTCRSTRRRPDQRYSLCSSAAQTGPSALMRSMYLS